MDLWQDCRYALRTMRRATAFTTVAILSLALGIGANTAIFSLVNALMLRLLPVREPRQLVELLRQFPGDPPLNAFSTQEYEFFGANNHVFSAMVAAGPQEFSVRREGSDTERLQGARVTGNFFPELGLAPAAGRLIEPRDTATVAVVSWDFWKSRYQLDRRILGLRLVIDNVPLTIAGVAPRGFTGLQPGIRQEIWLPLAGSRQGGLNLVARLRPGASIRQARAEMTVLYRRSIDAGINDGGFVRAMTVSVEPAGAGLSYLRQKFGRPFLLVMAVVALLLLIACTNIASLLLARGTARQREMALRVSLGAGRLRLARQVLTESLLLAGAGSLLGILLANIGTRVLVGIVNSGRQRFDLDAAPDATVLLFTAAIAILTGLLFGLAPALQAFTDLRRAAETRPRRLLREALVAAQIALSVVLLSSAMLFIRHLAGGYAALGFQRDGVLLVTLDPSHSGYQRRQLAGPYRDLLDRLSAIPGVLSATLCGASPLSGAGASRDATVEGYQPKAGELRYVAENWVAPRYFETLGQPLLAGRDFTFEDENKPRVAIVNRTFARQYFGDGSALGKHVLLDGDDKPYEIVGVVADARYLEMREASGRVIYFNAFQEGRLFSQFALRAAIPPASLAPEVRSAVRAVLANVPVQRIATLAGQVDASIVPERLIVTLSGLFGFLGAVLAGVGIYGLLAYTVARRVNEIGIRMALGATHRDIARMVLAGALRMACAGLGAAVPLTLWSRRFAAALVSGLTESTLASVAAGAAAMLALALLAAYLPARRASRVDPMEALRYE